VDSFTQINQSNDAPGETRQSAFVAMLSIRAVLPIPGRPAMTHL